jgi:phosphatidylglycerophosphate synthase
MFNPKHWPNVLSGTRLALMPFVLGAALADSRRAFVVLLGFALSTDVFDGYLARKLNAFSDLGRKLDSLADYVTMITGIVGIALLWPGTFERELPWIVAGLGAFFGVVAYGFLRLGRAPCYHTWLAKAGGAACALSMIPLLTDFSEVPFHVAIALQIGAGIDELAIALLVPRHVGEMASSWHAWKLRQSRRNDEASSRPLKVGHD